MMILLLLFIIILICYFLLKKKYEYWDKLGIPGPKPRLLVGNIGESFIMKKNMADILKEIYDDYPDEPFVGIYRGGTPCLLVRDPEFIKHIVVKDFKFFYDNDFYVDKKVDPILGRGPFSLKGEEWKSTRAQLTPGFTTGKMKNMLPLMEEVAQQMVKYLIHQPKTNNSFIMEAKELCTKFTINSVALCVFGIDGKCFEEENSNFRDLAHQYTSHGTWQGVMLTLTMTLPELTQFLPIKIVKKEVEDRLMTIVRQTLQYRKEHNLVRNDFFQFLAQLMQTKPDFDEIDVTAHAASFFGDGFETSSLVMSYLLYELAVNPEVQERLRKEISSIEEKYIEGISYEAFLEMNYLDACINECMRIHPVFGVAKTCTQRYSYKSESADFRNRSVNLEPGAVIILPIEGLHRDPKYFPDPEKFLPERMLNKENIKKCTFMPFGEGPRACIGQRFGLLQLKVGLVYIIKNYKLTLNTRTKLPLTKIPWYFLNSAKGGLWLNFEDLSASPLNI